MRASAYALMPADEAARIVLERTPVLDSQRLPLATCAGRVAAEDVRSTVSLPRLPSSAVDGYALRAADSGRRLQVAGESAAGHPFEGHLPDGAAIRIMTGGVLPEGADCVVMVEDTSGGEGWVEVPAGLVEGANFHRVGADLVPGDLLVARGTQLGPAEMGLAASAGYPELWVHARPRVALISTGDELVEAGSEPGPGQVVDSNRWALLAALTEAGAEVEVLGIAPDSPDGLRRVVEGALSRCDVLVTSGGVSVGTHDLVKPLLESLGEVHIGRVKLRPGKPFTFATLAGGRIAFGLPGFPVSSLVTFEVFVRPALRKMQGHARLLRPTLPARLGYAARAAGDRTEYQRVRLERQGGGLVAHTTGSQSSSRLLSLFGAHALIRVPPGSGGLPAGSTVEVLILDLP